MPTPARRDETASFTAFAVLVTALALSCGASVFVALTSSDIRSIAAVVATTLAIPLVIGTVTAVVGRFVGRAAPESVSASTR